MTGPLPLPVTFVMAAVMGVAALYCAGRLAVVPFTDRVSDRTADVLHVVAGAVMVAMLLGGLNRRWDVVWVLGFAAAGLWFLRAAVAGPAGRHGLQHGLQHAAECLAMVVMLVASQTPYVGSARALASQGTQGMAGMGGMGRLAGGGTGSTTVGGLLVLTLAVGVLVLATVEVRAVVATGPAPATTGARATPTPRPMLAPRCAAACRVAMGVTMGVALLSLL